MTKVLVSLLITFSTFGVAIAQQTDEVDCQIQNEAQFVFPLDKKKYWTASLSLVGRFGENVTHASDCRVGVAEIQRKVQCGYFLSSAGRDRECTAANNSWHRHGASDHL